MVEQVEQIVSNILDDILDGNDSEDIITELNKLLVLVGSDKNAEELLQSMY